MNFKTISAKEAKNAFGSFLDSAQREPVMITKRDRPVGIFFSMHDIESLMQVSDALKEEIHKGILAGLSDVEAGRVKELNELLIVDLQARLRARLSNK
jgi:prevent-host-death family protein